MAKGLVNLLTFSVDIDWCKFSYSDQFIPESAESVRLKDPQQVKV